jgi:hypothetical protein
MLWKEALRAFNGFRYRDRLVSTNLSDLVKGNYESALAVFKGFFGEPSWAGPDTFLAFKNVNGEYPYGRFRHAQALVERFGWRLSAHACQSGSGLKIVLMPNGRVSGYLSDRALAEAPVSLTNNKELYRSLL